MLKDYIGIISAGKKEISIGGLTNHRPLASLPIFGRYRVIDMTISNMVNSGIVNVGVFTDPDSRSLSDHLGNGKSWELDRKIGGLFIFNYSSSSRFNDIKLLQNNIEYLYRSKEKNVLVSSTHMVCNIDLTEAAIQHEKSNSDITVIYKKVKNTDNSFYNCKTLNINHNNRVTSVGKNIGSSNEVNISMEMFIMKKSKLLNIVHDCIERGVFSTLKNAIYQSVKKVFMNAYEFKGTLKCINSVNNYYNASMDIFDLRYRKEIFFGNGKMYTKSKDSPPTRYLNGSKVNNSIISDGCTIRGKVENSIIGRGVIVSEGAHIKDSIVFQKSVINRNCRIENAILDKHTYVRQNKELIGDKEHPLVIERDINKNYYETDYVV